MLLSSWDLAEARGVKTDSLLQAARSQTNRKERVRLELAAVKEYAQYSVDSAINLNDSLIGVYTKENMPFGLARAKSLKSWYITFQARYEESMKLQHEALAIQEADKEDTSGLAYTYMRLAISYLHFYKIQESETYFTKSRLLFSQLHDTSGLDMVLNNLGALFSEIDPQKAIRYYKQSLALRQQVLNNAYWIAYSYYNIGSAYLGMKEYDSAYHFLDTAYHLFQNKTGRPVPSMVILGLAHYHFETENFKAAEHYGRIALAEAKQRNHTELIIESTYLLAETCNKLGKFEEAFSTLKDYQRLKNDFDSLNNAAQVAELELKYNTAKKEQEIAELESEKLSHKTELEQAKSTTLLAIFFSLSAVIAGLFFFLRKQQKQKLHASKLEAGLAEIKLVALRAQMNPHFIFNCINTAQNFVLNAEKAEAYDYLAKFAKLLRMVLENSGKTYVPLEDELRQIRLYIELELIRFKHKFLYKLELDPELENGVYEIPGMILQPFIENAIIHGLMNKQDTDAGLLTISLALHAECIRCIILDNGIGRVKAQEIKMKKASHYQSKALPNIEERLAILSEGARRKISYSIDNVWEKEEPGTKIVLDLPFK